MILYYWLPQRTKRNASCTTPRLTWQTFTLRPRSVHPPKWGLKRTRRTVILSVLEPRKCENLKENSLDFEHAYMTTYLASWEACRYFFAALWQGEEDKPIFCHQWTWDIGKGGGTTSVWRHVAHCHVIVLCGSEGEWCTKQGSVYSSFEITGWQAALNSVRPHLWGNTAVGIHQDIRRLQV